jgi:hypothetical protein
MILVSRSYIPLPLGACMVVGGQLYFYSRLRYGPVQAFMKKVMNLLRTMFHVVNANVNPV